MTIQNSKSGPSQAAEIPNEQKEIATIKPSGKMKLFIEYIIIFKAKAGSFSKFTEIFTAEFT